MVRNWRKTISFAEKIQKISKELKFTILFYVMVRLMKLKSGKITAHFKPMVFDRVEYIEKTSSKC